MMNDNIDYCHHDSKTLNTNYYQVLNGGRSSGKTFQIINMYQEKYNKLQSNWNSLREIIKDCNKRYEDSNIELNDTYKYYLNSPLPPRYTMNLGAIELIDYLLDKMNELEGKDNN